MRFKRVSFSAGLTSAMTLQVASVMTVWNQLRPSYATNLWNEALNMRLGTEVSLTVSLLRIFGLER